MNKIVKIGVGVVGVIAIFFLIRIIGAGDDAIENDLDLQGSLVSPFMYIAYIVLAIIVAIVAFFSLKNIITRPAVLKSTLKNVGAFAVLAAIAYFAFAKGVETPLKDGDILSEGGSKLVGAGLYLFYFLLVAAIGLMLYTGIKKTIK